MQVQQQKAKKSHVGCDYKELHDFVAINWPCLCHLHAVPMREWNKNALTNMKGDLMDNVKPKESGILPKLAKAAELGFLNDPEMQTIEAMTSERDRMDKIISILSGKADECFSKFCDILTKSNNEVWAESLRAKAEEFKGSSGKILTQ